MNKESTTPARGFAGRRAPAGVVPFQSGLVTILLACVLVFVATWSSGTGRFSSPLPERTDVSHRIAEETIPRRETRVMPVEPHALRECVALPSTSLPEGVLPNPCSSNSFKARPALDPLALQVRVLEDNAPRWSAEIAADGTLSMGSWSALAPTVAVELSADVVQLSHVETTTHALPLATLAENVVQLAAGPRELEVALVSEDLASFLGSDAFTRGDENGALATHYQPSVRFAESSLLLAHARVRLNRNEPAARVRLPHGRYRLHVLHCEVGWILDDRSVDLGGDPLVLRATPVPIIEVPLPLDEGAHPRAPRDVGLALYQEPLGFTGELALNFEVVDGRARASLSGLEPRAGESYAVRLTWPDESISESRRRSWDSLAWASIDVAPPGRTAH